MKGGRGGRKREIERERDWRKEIQRTIYQCESDMPVCLEGGLKCICAWGGRWDRNHL